MSWEDILKNDERNPKFREGDEMEGYWISDYIPDYVYGNNKLRSGSSWWEEAADEKYMDRLLEEFIESGEEYTKEAVDKWLEKNVSQEEYNRMAKEIRYDDYGPAYEDFGPVEGYKDYY